MKSKNRFLIIAVVSIFGIVLIYTYFAILQGGDALAKLATATTQATDTPTGIWLSFLQTTPFPYTTPLPGSEKAPLDGTYAKYDPSYPQWWACRRCAEYRPAGGVWRMRFDRGVMHIYYEVTGWRTLASYTVSGNRLYVFNDPICKDATGEYVWELVGGNLSLEVVNDPCSFQLRGKNLSGMPWNGCQPPSNQEEWQAPRGCTDPVIESVAQPLLPVSWQVIVREGDARNGSDPPDVIINASGVDLSPSDGVRLSFSEDSIFYGLNRVLWAESDWLEITTDMPYSTMGVQFLGDYVIGWARVLFDGEEVWRGDTSKIWSAFGRFGGYIEVSGFEPGEHTLRVERLDFDSRPIVIAFLGFDR